MHESGGRKAAPRLWLLQGKLAGDNAQVLALGHSLSATGFDAEPRTIGAEPRIIRHSIPLRWFSTMATIGPRLRPNVYGEIQPRLPPIVA